MRCCSTPIPVSFVNWVISSSMILPSAPVSPFQYVIVGFPCAAAFRARDEPRAAPPSPAAPGRTPWRVIPRVIPVPRVIPMVGCAPASAVMTVSSPRCPPSQLDADPTTRRSISSRRRHPRPSPGTFWSRRHIPDEGSVMARIGIDLARRIGTVDRRIFGNFIEHLGRCIYGGLYDEGSRLADARGFRTDVLDAARPLRIPVLRWPGGNFVSGYHWLDGVGPKDARPRRSDLAWYAEESNRFGTDEFIEYCRVLGTDPFICVNMGSGTMDEAQAWVEYCNGTGNTSWAQLRRRHGHAEPYRVRYWGLGNEMYGSWQIGNLNAHDYVKKARAFAAVMKRTDPSIQLVSCGQNGWSEWDEIVLSGLAEFVDFHSIHLYTGC